MGLIVVIKDLIEKNSPQWKKPTWQKLLIGSGLIENGFIAENILYLDTDFLISPFAPNIFDVYDANKIAVVSQVKNLNQPLNLTLKRLAFLRHTYFDKAYPLDSALFMPVEEIFKYHNLKPFYNYFCAGFFIFNVANHSKIMKKWFYKYNASIKTITKGDEPILNYEFQAWNKLQWLPYQFHALWTYEIAFKYPFLFEKKNNHKKLIKDCIEASLYVNNFLHFAGSWHECQMWKTRSFFTGKKKRELVKKFEKYLKKPQVGKPKGLIKPK